MGSFAIPPVVSGSDLQGAYTVVRRPENKSYYRSCFDAALPHFRPAWKNAGPHHEMMVRSSCKKRKLEAAEVADAVGSIVPRKVEGEQTSGSRQTYLIQEEASVVVANQRSSGSRSISNEFNVSSIDTSVVAAAAAAAVVAVAGVPGPGISNISNKARRVARGGTFRF